MFDFDTEVEVLYLYNMDGEEAKLTILDPENFGPECYVVDFSDEVLKFFEDYDKAVDFLYALGYRF
jgi:hypothetical protein